MIDLSARDTRKPGKALTIWKEPAMKAAANPLREARKSKGLSQEAVARAARITQARLSEFETGARKPGLAVLYRIASVTQPELAAALRPYVDGADELAPTG